jgi:hypothetical protein
VNASTAERMAIARPAGLTLSSSASSPALVLPAANPFIAFSLTPKTDTGIADARTTGDVKNSIVTVWTQHKFTSMVQLEQFFLEMSFSTI